MKKSAEMTKATFSIDKRMLELAKTIFGELGMSFDNGIAVYLYQVVYTRSIPFPIKLPPREVLEQVDLYKKIIDGLDDVKAGRVIPGEVFFEKLKEKYGGGAMENLSLEKVNEIEAFIEYLDAVNHQVGEGADIKPGTEFKVSLGERELSIPLNSTSFNSIYNAIKELLQ